MPVCLICQRSYQSSSLLWLLAPRKICPSCFSKFALWWRTSQVHDYPCLTLYRQNAFTNELLQQYYHANDQALAPAFLNMYILDLKTQYAGTVLVPLEITPDQGIKTAEIFAALGLPLRLLFAFDGELPQLTTTIIPHRITLVSAKSLPHSTTLHAVKCLTRRAPNTSIKFLQLT